MVALVTTPGKPQEEHEQWAMRSTQVCHRCGFKNDALTLSDRTWQWPICGSVHDRAINAALNIKKVGLRLLAVGHAESRNAWGGLVRPPMVAWPDAARIPRL